MKKYLTLLCTSLIILLMFAAPASPVKAAENTSDETTTVDHPCGCNVAPILGAERNKMVSDLLKSDEFKNTKKEYKDLGYSWNGAHEIEIIKNLDNGMILIGVPFTAEDGIVDMFVFMDGKFLGVTPRN